MHHSGVVDQNVEPSEFFPGLLNRIANLRFTAYVAPDWKGLKAVRGEGGGDAAVQGGASTDDRDFCAFMGKQARGGFANA